MIENRIENKLLSYYNKNLQNIKRYEESVKHFINDGEMDEEFYKILEIEVLNLTKAALSKGVVIVQIKGLSLAVDLYNKKTKRAYKDIDCLVKYTQINDTINILYENGYEFINGKRKVIDDYSKPSRHVHIEPLEKFVNGYRIKIDLHLYIYYKEEYFDEELNENIEIVERAKTIKIDDSEIYTLDLNDNIIMLLSHTTKHYLDAGFHNMINNEKSNCVLLKSLHDLALLIDKYNSVINWDKLLDKILQLKIQNTILFSLQIYNEIYKNMIPLYFINKLKTKKLKIDITSSFSMKFLYLILGKKPLDIIMDKYEELLPLIIKKLSKPKRIISCLNVKHINDLVKISEWKIEFNDSDEKHDNYFSTYLRGGDSNDNIKCSFQSSWDKEFLYVYMEVHTASYNFLSKNPFYKRDSIQLFFCDNNFHEKRPFLQGLIIQPKNIDNKMQVDMLDFRTEELLNKIIVGKGNSFKNGYNISITIPWRYLEILPCIEKDIYFDIVVNNINNNGEVKQLVYSSVSETIDPTLYNQLKLK